MILEQQKEAQVVVDGEDQEQIAMSLDLDSAQILMQMLSKNLYSDEIGSTVRELASNALDSHRRAGVDKPIIVSLKYNQQYNYEFTVEDFGIGLDDDDVRNIISKYGKSTKRNSANELGMMGLGFKAPLAYTSSFYFIARKNNVERKYMMYEGESGNMIDLLYEQPTTEGNGVKVIVSLKGYDKVDFIVKTKQQLAYFESVYFDVDNINNGFSITRAEDFQYSDMVYDPSMHICLDNVYYPLDFAKVGIDRINVPVGLRFGLSDGIFPTPNREAIRYTQEAKKAIVDKIHKVADFFVTKYNETITDTDDLKDIFDYYKGDEMMVTLGGKEYDISTLNKYSNVPIVAPKLKGIKLLNLERLTEIRNSLMFEYVEKYKLRNGKMMERKNNLDSVTPSDIDGVHWYVFSDKIAGNKREYIKSLLRSGSQYHFVKRSKNMKLGGRRSQGHNNYYNLLELNNYGKHLWRRVIQEYQSIQKRYSDKLLDLDAIEIPKAWLDNRKVKSVSTGGSGRRIKLEGELIGKIAVDTERYTNRSCKFVPETFKLQTFPKFPGLIIYTHHDKNDDLERIYGVTRFRKYNRASADSMQFKLITFSERELKNVEKLEVHNLMSYEKFMEGKNKPFKRLVTAYVIYKLMEANKALFEKKHHFDSISKDLYDKITRLRDYRMQNFLTTNETLYQAMLEVAEEKNLFDPEIYDDYLDVKKLISKMPFITSILKAATNNSHRSDYGMQDSEIHSVLCDLFKYYKHRIDYTNYRLKLNEDVPSEQDENLTDELVEDLQDQV